VIPAFPMFKRLDLADQVEISAFVRNFPPYSDFNFTSLYCYNIHDDCEVSFHQGNLVVKMRDYITGQPFYTFLGANDVDVTIIALLSRSKSDGVEPTLRLIPECVVSLLPQNSNCTWVIREDRNSFDYIYNVANLNTLAGPAYREKRSNIARFRRTHPEFRTMTVDLKDVSVRREIETLLHLWQTNKCRSDTDVEIEFAAIHRCFECVRYFGAMSLGLVVDGVLVAFEVSETIHDGYAVGHFLKADPMCKFASDVMQFEMVKEQVARGCQWFNCEQDLGIPGLRQSKQSWRPLTLLKKYTISSLAH